MKKEAMGENPALVTAGRQVVFSYALLAVVGCVCFANVAYASPMQSVLCGIVNDFITGNDSIGAGLATIGVGTVGIGAILGKVSWGLALTVTVGIGVMFGAGTVLSGVFGIQDPCGG